MPDEPSHPLLPDAVRRLREGRLVAFPTETVYGLAADALNPDAVQRVFNAKQRPANNPLIVHVADADMARPLVTSWPAEADLLARRFWPGPLTLVLPRSPLIPDLVTGKGPTVALRCPDHPIALALLRALNRPLVGPSANPSGFVSPTRAEHVVAAFAPDDVLVLDGGPCRVGIESTVLSLVHTPPRILRLGAISAHDIQSILNQPIDVAPPSTHTPDAPLPSPGLLQRHYAPRARVILFATSLPQAAPDNIVVLAHRAPRNTLASTRILQMPREADAYAARLYDALREADDLAPDAILVERPEDEGSLWDAIRDRLARASS